MLRPSYLERELCDTKSPRIRGGLVLKPQREGEGNNVYKEAIPAFLDILSPDERQAWVDSTA
jgi:hypothetical protein